MALNIWDLSDAPKPSTNKTFANDLVGKIKGGYSENGQPVASSTIVFTTDDPEVATATAEAFGGEVQELDVDRGDDHRVVSDVTTVKLTLDNPQALRTRFALYGQAGLIFATDGQDILEGEDFAENTAGMPWTTRPKTLESWKAGAKEGRQPRPDIKLKGKLADNPDLGYFQYSTTGWSLVRDLPAIEQQLEDAFEASGGEPIAVELKLGEVTMKKGAYAGKSYTRPFITVL